MSVTEKCCVFFCEQDAEQTKFKQLQRQVKRERKGAMRELKRDAAFLEHAKADKTAEKERTRQGSHVLLIFREIFRGFEL